jgi:hypothetical protein
LGAARVDLVRGNLANASVGLGCGAVRKRYGFLLVKL